MTVGAPDGNAQGLVWSVRFPSGDLVFHGVPRRHDERVRQDREVQQLSDVSRAYLLRLLKSLNPCRFVVSLFCEFVGSIRVVQGSLRMLVSRLAITLFIVLGSSAVGLGGKLVVLSSLLVQIVHNTS